LLFESLVRHINAAFRQLQPQPPHTIG
jgi:hypothetical protein